MSPQYQGLPTGPRGRASQAHADPPRYSTANHPDYDRHTGTRSAMPGLPQTPRAPHRGARDLSLNGAHSETGLYCRATTPEPPRQREATQDVQRNTAGHGNHNYHVKPSLPRAPSSHGGFTDRRHTAGNDHQNDGPHGISARNHERRGHDSDDFEAHAGARSRSGEREVQHDMASRPGSTSTQSSAHSSLLDRMKARSTATSTRTSVDEEPLPLKASLQTPGPPRAIADRGTGRDGALR